MIPGARFLRDAHTAESLSCECLPDDSLRDETTHLVIGEVTLVDESDRCSLTTPYSATAGR
jgi:hypothetical protein